VFSYPVGGGGNERDLAVQSEVSADSCFRLHISTVDEQAKTMVDTILGTTEERDERKMPRWVPWLAAALIMGSVGTMVLVRTFQVVDSVIWLVLFSLFLSFAMEPAVNALARRGWRRGVATGLVMFGTLGVLIGALIVALPAFIREIARFVENLPQFVEEVGQRFGADISAENLQQALEDRREELASLATTLAGNVLSVTGWLLGLLAQMLAALLISFYLTADAPRVRRSVCSLFPPRAQREILRAWEISIDKVGGYLYTRGLMGVLSGVTLYTLLRILGLPLAMPMALFAGFVSQFIPMVGTYIGYGLPVFIALAEGGTVDALILVAFAATYQQIENMFISPRISAKAMDLHPAIAFTAALLGGAIAGAWGAFLALPVAAIVQAFLSTFIRRHAVVESELTQETEEA
jgi:predicted PurR-regulated permease PerM